MSTETRLRRYFAAKVATLDVAGQPMPAAPPPLRRTRMSAVVLATAAALAIVGLPLLVLSLITDRPSGIEDSPPVTSIATTTITTHTMVPSMDTPAMARFAALIGSEERSSTEGVLYAFVPSPTPLNLPGDIAEQPLRAPTATDATNLGRVVRRWFVDEPRWTPLLLTGINNESGAFTVVWVAPASDGSEEPVFCAAVVEGDGASWSCGAPGLIEPDATPPDTPSKYALEMSGSIKYLQDQGTIARPISMGSGNLPLETAYTILVGPHGDQWMQRPVSGTVLFSIDTPDLVGTYELFAHDRRGNQLAVGMSSVSAPTDLLPPVEPTCGATLPYEVQLPTDFTGPIDGPSPDSSAPTEDGQFIVHWTGRDGSVEFRWPPNATYTEDAVWGEPTRAGNTDTIFLTQWTPIIDGVEQPPVVDAFAGLPSDDMQGRCDAVQLDVYRSSTEPGSPTEPAGAAFADPPKAAGDDGLPAITIYPDLARPRDIVLIVETVDVEAVPPVVECGGAPGVETPPNVTRTVNAGPVFNTPQQALRALLETTDAETWPKTGYFELIEPDGSITYGNPLDDLSVNPGISAGLVISISATQTSNGWTIDSWETSGC